MIPAPLFVLLVLVSGVSAQASYGGEPLSAGVVLEGDVPALVVAVSEDAGGAPAIGRVDVDLAAAARWQPARDGGRVGRLRVEVPGAAGMHLAFARFQLPAGASLFAYDDARRVVRGAFTALSNRLDGRFDLGPVPAGALTLEVHEPAGVDAPCELVLEAVLPALGPLPGAIAPRSAQEPLRSPPCNVDVACPEGDGWRVAARSVVAIVLPNEFCTGVLLNNTNEDGTPYVLTARHCGALGMATFRFNWLRASCDEDAEPIRPADMVAGSRLVAEDPDLDFQLVRLDAPPPAEFGALYAGWDRGGARPERVACLHHPGGDYMKVSLDEDGPRKRKKHFVVADWERGTTSRGSSGAPLFDPAQRVVGSLEGGDSTCASPVDDYFLRLERIWKAVGPALDPLGTGATTLDALDPATADLSFTVTGLSPARPTTAERRVEVIGRGFGARVVVRVDGERLDWRSVDLVSNSRLSIQLPALEPGEHVLKVYDGPDAAKLTFVVVAAGESSDE